MLITASSLSRKSALDSDFIWKSSKNKTLKDLKVDATNELIEKNGEKIISGQFSFLPSAILLTTNLTMEVATKKDLVEECYRTVLHSVHHGAV